MLVVHSLQLLLVHFYVKKYDTSLMKDVKVYSKTDCKFCTYSKDFLKSYDSVL